MLERNSRDWRRENILEVRSGWCTTRLELANDGGYELQDIAGMGSSPPSRGAVVKSPFTVVMSFGRIAAVCTHVHPESTLVLGVSNV